jgi:hypothetical protein
MGFSFGGRFEMVWMFVRKERNNEQYAVGLFKGILLSKNEKNKREAREGFAKNTNVSRLFRLYAKRVLQT